MTPPRDNVRAMLAMAEAYARELDAQWNTLRLLTDHNPENGRVHEHFLRGVLRRFLPLDVQVGTGFLATQAHTSNQTDIVVYESGKPTLFSAGDLVVTDSRATLAAIEVKTSLNGERLREFLDSCLATKTAFRQQADLWPGVGRELFCALYAIDGPSRSNTIEHFHAWAAKAFPAGRTPEVRHCVPDVVYVRGKYILVREAGMCDPFVAVDVGALKQEEGSGDGMALMLMVACLYRTRFFGVHQPWWLHPLDIQRLPGGETVSWPAQISGTEQ